MHRNLYLTSGALDMEKIKWCMKLKNGIELVEPNNNLCDTYIKKAENALKAVSVLKGNKEWEVSSCYYAMYFALYSIMMKIGVKCENHSCSTSFMKEYLSEKFKKNDPDFLKKSMNARIDTQYYSDRHIADEFYQKMLKYAPVFLVKCKEITNSIKQEEINQIREKLEKIKEELDKTGD